MKNNIIYYMGRKIMLHLHTDVRDKKPLPSDIMTGELAINYAANGETLYIKNSEEAIAEFKDDKYSIIKVDLVFPILHGKNGEDGTLQGYLKMLNMHMK